MPNAKDANSSTSFQKILVLGKTGAGKTAQLWSLPGRKFVYLFDPAGLLTLRGCDLEYEQFLPDALEMDATLKGFSKNSKDDKPPLNINPKTLREPSVYMRWVEDLNRRVGSGYFNDFDWVCFDSLTLLAQAVMDRQLWLNNRYGGIEELADYRVVGNKIAEVFRSICSLPVNLYCTGHINTYQDEKTKRIDSAINLPGKARALLPLLFSNIWEIRATTDDDTSYVLFTKPEPRGFQDIRTTIKGLKPREDITIKDFKRAGDYGIGKLIKSEMVKPPAAMKPAVALPDSIPATPPENPKPATVTTATKLPAVPATTPASPAPTPSQGA